MRIAFPTDEHYPYQDDLAREVAMMIVQDFNPDVLVVGSDGMDFYAVSHFDKDPARIKIDLQKEIELWQGGQREWSLAAPNAKKRFIPGNHEDRLRRYLWAHPELSGLEALRLDNLLGFESLGIEWDGDEYTQAEIEFFGKLVIRHGRYVRPRSAMSALAELENERYAVSMISGHTHRGGTAYATTREGVVTAQEGFCLCRLDPQYMARPNWQQGIVLADVDDTHLSIEAVPINTFQRWKVAHWRGEEYRA